MATIASTYGSTGEWLRGNLHSHTTVSDGTRPAEEVIADYESRLRRYQQGRPFRN